MAYRSAESAGGHEFDDSVTEVAEIIRRVDLDAEQTVEPVAAESEEDE